jgi:hypothetical protein
MKKGKPVMDLMGEVQKTIAEARAEDATAGLAGEVEQSLNKLGEVAMHLGASAMSPQVLSAFAHANSFMEVTGDVTMAWMLLWRAAVSAKKIAQGAKKKDVAFYEGQIKTADYFINTILPVTFGKMASILKTCGAAVDMSEASFGGK